MPRQALDRNQLVWHLVQHFHKGVPFSLSWVDLYKEGRAGDYSGLDFSHQEAIQYDFHGRMFWYCSFQDGTFDGSEFDGAGLYHAEMQDGSFIAATFTGAGMDKVSATGANFSFARLTVLSADSAIFRHTTLYKARLCGDFLSADFEGANLREANLELCDLRWANFRHADCTGATFKDAELEGADMTGAILEGCNLEEARYKPVYRREWRTDLSCSAGYLLSWSMGHRRNHCHWSLHMLNQAQESRMVTPSYRIPRTTSTSRFTTKKGKSHGRMVSRCKATHPCHYVQKRQRCAKRDGICRYPCPYTSMAGCASVSLLVQSLVQSQTHAIMAELQAVQAQMDRAVQSQFEQVYTLVQSLAPLYSQPAQEREQEHPIASGQGSEPLEQRIKRYILEQRRQGGEPSLAEIMDRCNCSKGSAIRFCRELGESSAIDERRVVGE